MVVDVNELVEGIDLLLDISVVDVTVIVKVNDLLSDDDKLLDVTLVINKMPLDESRVAGVTEVVDVTFIVEADDIPSEMFNISLVVCLTVLIEVEDDILLDVSMVDDVTTPGVVSCDALSAPSVTGLILLEEDS